VIPQKRKGGLYLWQVVGKAAKAAETVARTACYSSPAGYRNVFIFDSGFSGKEKNRGATTDSFHFTHDTPRETNPRPVKRMK
jgi:hypothetical protein